MDLYRQFRKGRGLEPETEDRLLGFRFSSDGQPRRAGRQRRGGGEGGGEASAADGDGGGGGEGEGGGGGGGEVEGVEGEVRYGAAKDLVPLRKGG